MNSLPISAPVMVNPPDGGYVPVPADDFRPHRAKFNWVDALHHYPSAPRISLETAVEVMKNGCTFPHGLGNVTRDPHPNASLAQRLKHREAELAQTSVAQPPPNYRL